MGREVQNDAGKVLALRTGLNKGCNVQYGWKRHLCSQKSKSCACCYGRNFCKYAFALSLLVPLTLYHFMPHLHKHKLSPQPSTFHTKNQWWVTFSHKMCKYRWINTLYQHILSKYTLPVLFVYLSLIWWGWSLWFHLICTWSSAWADEPDWKQEAVFLAQRISHPHSPTKILMKWTEMVDMATAWTQA